MSEKEKEKYKEVNDEGGQYKVPIISSPPRGRRRANSRARPLTLRRISDRIIAFAVGLWIAIYIFHPLLAQHRREIENWETMQKGRRSWVSGSVITGVQRSRFPGPFDHFVFTFISAVERDMDQTYQDLQFTTSKYIQVLSFISDARAVESASTISIPPIAAIRCKFSGNHFRPFTSAATHKQPHSAVFLILCPLDENIDSPTDALDEVQLELEFDVGFNEDMRVFRTEITLESQVRAIETSYQIAAICTKPIDATINFRELLEWRLHHAFVGVETVFWYARDNRLQRLVQSLNAALSVHDVFRWAPPVVHAYHGDSADETVYYADCIAQAAAHGNIDWVTQINLDEWLIPDHRNTRHREVAINDYLDHQLPQTSAIYMGSHRALGVPPKSAHNWSQLDSIQAGLQPPYSDDSLTTIIAIMRVNAVELPSSDAPLALYRSWDAPIGSRGEDGLKIVHIPSLPLSQEDLVADNRVYMDKDWHKYMEKFRESYYQAEKIVEWPCDKVIC